MAIQSSILAWTIPGAESYSWKGGKEVGVTEHTHNATLFGKKQNLDTTMLHVQGSASNQKLVNLLTMRKE